MSMSDEERLEAELDGLSHLVKRLGLEAHGGDSVPSSSPAGSDGKEKKGLFQRLGSKRDPSPTLPKPGGPPKSTFDVVDGMMAFSSQPMAGPLLKLPPDLAQVAVMMFRAILRYCGDSSEMLGDQERDILGHQIITQAMQGPAFTDELYLQLVKQSRRNPRIESLVRVWELLCVTAACVSPSKEIKTPLVSGHLHRAVKDARTPEPVQRLAQKCLGLLSKTVKNPIPRMKTPTVEEVGALRTNQHQVCMVYFVDGNYEEVTYDLMTTGGEAIMHVSKLIHLNNYKDHFGLFIAFIDQGGAIEASEVDDDQPIMEDDEAASGDPTGSRAAFDDRALEDGHYLSDILAAVSEARRSPSSNGRLPVVMFKKRVFRDGDDKVDDKTFQYLSFLQLQDEYIKGNYPVVPADAARLCAVLTQANGGLARIEDLAEKIARFVPSGIRMALAPPGSEGEQDLMQVVHEQIREMGDLRQIDAQAEFMRFVADLPHGNSRFFFVERQMDPTGLLPPRAIIGVNKRGIHIFRPVPREYILSADLRDIMQFGSNSNAVFFKMRLSGTDSVIQAFQFATTHGDEICKCLKVHIDDHMRKREAAQRARMQIQQAEQAANAQGAVATQAVQDLQRELHRAREEQGALRAERDHAVEERERIRRALIEAEERLRVEASTDAQRAGALGNMTSQVDGLQQQVLGLQQALARAEAERRAAVERGGASGPASSAELLDKEGKIAALTEQLNSTSAAASRLKNEAFAKDQEVLALQKDLQLAEGKLQRLEAAQQESLGALQGRLEADINRLKTALQEKEARVDTLEQSLASTEAKLRKKEEDMFLMSKGLEELAELKEFKAEAGRREEQQRTLMQQQTARLQEYERLYKEELNQRKKYFNMLEDAKGKIRVYARVRPMLKKELTEKQKDILSYPDNYTLILPWKEEVRTYDFDRVFNPADGQDKVFEDVSYLVQSAVDGFNVCIFAYGQTGSGKTFTIYGTDDLPGITPRAVNDLFSLVSKLQGKYSVDLRFTMLELYQENLVDLLNKGKTDARAAYTEGSSKLEIKKDPKGIVYVPGAEKIPVRSAQELLAAIARGQSFRRTASTQMNVESSRSHLVMSVYIESTNLQTQGVARGKLSFVDLAGSERVKKSMATGQVLKEAQAINKSLSALGDVIRSLTGGQPHIPYRNHKLTMLLSDSLGGNAKTLMFVNVSPTDGNVEETHNSLEFATTVRTVKNIGVADVGSKEVEILKAQIRQWKMQAGLASKEQQEEADLREIEDRVSGAP